MKVKTADQNVTGQTLTNDTDLALSLASGVVYNFMLQIQYNTLAAADFKFDITYSGTSSAYREWTMYSATSGANVASATPHTTVGTDTSVLHSTDGEKALMVNGAIVTTSAGTLQFRWAQNTTNVTATTVRSGGILRAWRVA